MSLRLMILFRVKEKMTAKTLNKKKTDRYDTKQNQKNKKN